MNKSPRIPNLYQLLGLVPLESDRQAIVTALKKIQARIKSQRDKHHADEIARLQKLLTLGQQVLLDQDRKAQYDAQWQIVYGASLASVGAAASSNSAHVDAAQLDSNSHLAAWSMGTLDTLLPEGDPHAAFDMAEYLRNSHVRDPAIAEADLNKLISLLGGEPLPSSIASDTPHALALTHDQLGQPSIYAQTGSLLAANDSGHDGIALGPSPSSASSVATLSQRMRKRQQRSLLFGGLGLVAGALALAGLFVYVNQPKSAPQSGTQQLAQAPTKQNLPVPSAQQPQPQSPPQQQSQPSTPQPQTPVAEPPAQPTASSVEALPAPGSEVPPAAKPMATNSSGLVQPGQATKRLEIQATPIAPAPMTPAAPTMPEPTSPASPPPPEPAAPTEAAKPEAPAMVDQPLTDEDKRQWNKDMKAVTTLLGKLDVATADKQLAEIKPNIKTGLQRQQHERLTAASGLVSHARQLIIDTILGLDAGEELTIKSTKVAYVGGDDTHIVIRQNASNKRFKLEELTAALAEVLIDQNSLDSKGLAAKGAYLMLHPKNSVVRASAQQALDDATKAGAISPELAKFYEDDYSLK